MKGKDIAKDVRLAIALECARYSNPITGKFTWEMKNVNVDGAYYLDICTKADGGIIAKTKEKMPWLT